MIQQNINKIISSTFLFIEREILSKGSGYYPVSARFYDVRDNYYGYYTYGSPYGSIIADSSLAGVIPMTGVYLNNFLISTGISGLAAIDYNRGKLHFSTQPSVAVSGNYYIKEFQFAVTDKSDEELLFETKHYRRPRIGEMITGIGPDQDTFPIIYLKFDGGENRPFAFGGMDDSKYYLRGIVLSDTRWNLDSVLSIVQDMARKVIPIIELNEYPYNALGSLTSGVYNYTGMTYGKPPNLFIDKSYISRLNQNFTTEVKTVGFQAQVGFFDIELSQHRYPRN